MNDPIEIAWLPADTITVTAGAYTADDVVGGLLRIREVFPVPGRGALLESLTIIDESDVLDAAAAHIVIFEKQPAASIADNAAMSTLADADAKLVQQVIQIATTDWQSLGSGVAAICSLKGLNLPLQGRDGSASVFAYLVTEGTPTFAATDDVTIKLGVIRS